MLAPSECSGDFLLQSSAVLPLHIIFVTGCFLLPQLEATGVSSAPKAIPDRGLSPELWIPIKRWEPSRTCWALCKVDMGSWAEQPAQTLGSWGLAVGALARQ